MLCLLEKALSKINVTGQKNLPSAGVRQGKIRVMHKSAMKGGGHVTACCFLAALTYST